MTTKKEQRRVKIKYRVRNKIAGTAARPRLTVFRSNKQIYVQIINDETASTLVAASSLGMETMPKKEQAAKVGEAVAAKAIAQVSLRSFSIVMVTSTTDVLKKLLMVPVKVDLNSN